MAGNERLLPAIILGIGAVFAADKVADGIERFRMADRTITVKGLAERDLESDFAIWNIVFRRGGNSFAEVQRALAADRELVVVFLKKAGLEPNEYGIQPLQIEDMFSRDFGPSNQPLRFTGTGRLTVSSKRIDLVSKTALGVDPLIQQGVALQGGNGPWYQLRGFNEAKAPLLAEATRNARQQAEQFAKEAGAKLGPLRGANQGVISITAANGNQFGDDLSARTERLRVVSTFQYELD
ncbi:MAG: SIMPL domain-containing protein [Gammaproteobacteria bacterium]|nr:SIMPL domain-containing protein [Gammaproteobacteria bacterium]